MCVAVAGAARMCKHAHVPRSLQTHEISAHIVHILLTERLGYAAELLTDTGHGNTIKRLAGCSESSMEACCNPSTDPACSAALAPADQATAMINLEVRARTPGSTSPVHHSFRACRSPPASPGSTTRWMTT